MAVYIVALAHPNEELRMRIRESYPSSFEYNPMFHLVSDDNLLSEDIANLIGIKGDLRIEDASGVIIRLTDFSYSGHTKPSLWEWLKEYDQ